MSVVWVDIIKLYICVRFYAQKCSPEDIKQILDIYGGWSPKKLLKQSQFSKTPTHTTSTFNLTPKHLPQPKLHAITINEQREGHFGPICYLFLGQGGQAVNHNCISFRKK